MVKAKTEKITVRFTKKMLKEIDKFIEYGWCVSRTEFIRNAVREYIDKELKNISEREKFLKKYGKK